MLLIEQADEWLVQRRYLSEHSIKQVLAAEPYQREQNGPTKNNKNKEAAELAA